MTQRDEDLVKPANVRESPEVEKAGRKLPVHRWPLWKAVGASVLLFLPFSAFLILVPPSFSRSAWLMAGAVIASGVLALNWGRWGDPRISEGLAAFVFTAQFLVIGLRAWSASVSVTRVWAFVVILAFLLAWGIPLLAPSLSEWLWREQKTPQTRVGRRLLGISLMILPAVGIIGASAGMLLARYGGGQTGWLIVAILATAVAIGWGQSASHQLFSARREGR